MTSNEAYLYATYHDVSVIVLNLDASSIAEVRTLRRVFPATAIIALSKDSKKRAAAQAAGAVAAPASVSNRKLAALVARVLSSGATR